MTKTLPNASILAPAQPAEQVSSRARAVTQVAALLLVALGLATMTGWLLRLPGLLQLLLGQVGMVFGTALCFALARQAQQPTGHGCQAERHQQHRRGLRHRVGARRGLRGGLRGRKDRRVGQRFSHRCAPRSREGPGPGAFTSSASRRGT